MPSSWERIPKELLEAILDSIEEHEFFTTRIRKKCLFQVMLTCKHWSSIAKDVFYNEQFKINMDTAKNLIADKTTRQLALKNIQVTYELANDAAFIKLLSMCPDLRSLRVEERSYRVAEASNAQKSFYTSLYTLSRSNHLAKLQRVNFPLNRAHADHLLAHHQQAMLQLKQSLTDLCIVDSIMRSRQQNHTQPPKQFVEWFDLLKEFPRLATLEIDVSSLIYLYEMDRFIQKVEPTITNLFIIMKYPVLRQPMETTAPAAIARRQAPLETLKIEMAYLRVEDIKYLMHKFDSVSNLQVDLWGALYDEDPATETLDLNSIQSADTFRQFIEYLTRVPTFLITKIRLFNRHLRQTLTDLKKCFQVKHLTISNLVDTSDTTVFSIKSLSKSRDGQRRPIYLDLEIGSAELLSVAKLVYEVLSDDVVELQFGDGLIDHYDSDDERYPSHLQGEAVKLGINMLPFLKVLTATNAEIRSMKSIVNPKAPKLALDLLDLGSFTHLEALLQMSQRIKSIKRWVAPCHIDYDENMVRQNYVLNMPFTTFGEMEIDSESVGRFIVKLTTSSNTTFHGFGLGKDKQLPAEEDYYQEDDEDPENYGYEELMEAIGKVTIVCADVKKLKVGVATIKIEN